MELHSWKGNVYVVLLSVVNFVSRKLCFQGLENVSCWKSTVSIRGKVEVLLLLLRDL